MPGCFLLLGNGTIDICCLALSLFSCLFYLIYHVMSLNLTFSFFLKFVKTVPWNKVENEFLFLFPFFFLFFFNRQTQRYIGRHQLKKGSTLCKQGI